MGPDSASLAALQAQLGEVQAQLEQLQERVGGALAEPEGELPALRAAVAEVAEAQAAQARGAEEALHSRGVLHSMLTDVMALARHTKVGESLRVRGT